MTVWMLIIFLKMSAVAQISHPISAAVMVGKPFQTEAACVAAAQKEASKDGEWSCIKGYSK